MKALWFSILAVSYLTAEEPALQLSLGDGTRLDLVSIPTGDFTQGSPPTEVGRAEDEAPRNTRLTKGFYIGKTAVTRGQWGAFVLDTGYRSEAEVGTSGGYGWDGKGLTQNKDFTWKNPGFPQTLEHPVCMLTLPDAEAFCRWVEMKSGRKTSLPTEAQWEYACRAMTTTAWHGGGPESTDQVAWHNGNAGDGTRPVNLQKVNPWGLSIGGNVSEWCLDWYAPYDPQATTDPVQTHPSPNDKPRRVLRGGSWLKDPKNTRSAARFRSDPRSRNADIGFRIVCATEAPAPNRAIPPIPPPLNPQIEDEPAIPLPDPTPLPQEKSIFSTLLGWLCLLVPVGLMVMLVRFVARGRNQTQVSPFVTMPPALVPKAGLAKVVRTGTDGFWMESDQAVGTSFFVRYMVDGKDAEQTVIYQPGPEGQFVFTGGQPNHITITRNSQLPPPLNRRRIDTFNDDHFDHRQRSIPPIFPSAY